MIRKIRKESDNLSVDLQNVTDSFLLLEEEGDNCSLAVEIHEPDRWT